MDISNNQKNIELIYKSKNQKLEIPQINGKPMLQNLLLR